MQTNPKTRRQEVWKKRKWKTLRLWLLIMGGVLAEAVCPLRAQITDLAIHDPSTLIKEGRTYWVFGTGPGCPAFSSPDRIHWTLQGSVFTSPPAWIKDAVPASRGTFLWAPDVRRVGGKYTLYYSVSTFGSNVSAIGLATSNSLAPGTWVDQGLVVRSQAQDNFNAIDPAIVQSRDGKLWLAFGSFWSGIKLIELDPTTGKRIAPTSRVYALAAHPQERNNAIEAPYLSYHAGYYYLFVNWDYCCRGSRSTYNIRIGRSTRITGPYVDKNGVDMLEGGGTLLLDSTPRADFGTLSDDRVGPGHAGILTERGVDRFSFHYEYVREGGGKSRLAIGTVAWARDGWPAIILPKEPVISVPAPPDQK